MGAGKKPAMNTRTLLLVLLAACEQARVGDDCSARYHCSVVDGVATCDDGFVFANPDDPTDYRCIPTGCATEGETRCLGQELQTCAGSRWTKVESCTGGETCSVVSERAACRDMQRGCAPEG